MGYAVEMNIRAIFELQSQFVKCVFYSNFCKTLKITIAVKSNWVIGFIYLFLTFHATTFAAPRTFFKRKYASIVLQNRVRKMDPGKAVEGSGKSARMISWSQRLKKNGRIFLDKNVCTINIRCFSNTQKTVGSFLHVSLSILEAFSAYAKSRIFMDLERKYKLFFRPIRWIQRCREPSIRAVISYRIF